MHKVQPTSVRACLHGRAGTVGRRLVATQEGLLAASFALALLAMTEIALVSDLDTDRSGTAVSKAILLGLGATLPIAAIRTHLVAATAAIASATLLAVLTDERPTVAGTVALAVSLFWLGARHRWPAAALMLVPFIAHAAFAMADPGTTNAPAVALALVTTAAVGVGRARQLRGRAQAHNASHESMTAAFLEYEARGERARIARELHDVVAHHISKIAVRAETARLATPGMPADGAHQLLAIGDTARTALIEMHRLLGVLREDADTGTTRQPQPGLPQLIELVDDARAWANATTRLVVRGCVAPLDPGIELSAYRIVQEGLSNARRHAPGAAVDVELDYTAEALLVRVRDNGPGPSGAITANGSSTGGHGLRGMRERAAAAGGSLRVGSAPVGGFLVEATLPAAGRATETITG
jgi:signal transduction histidine kinase